MKRTLLLAFILSLSLQSCTKDDIKIDRHNLLIGVWNFSRSDVNINVFARSREFIQGHCYQFNPDSTLIERTYAGFCGTPPVTYSDYPGEWSVHGDTLIHITAGYWGGTTTYKLDILSISDDSLKVVWLPD
jgi:hypothetical protein